MFSFDERVIPLDVWITSFVDWLVEGYRWFFQMIKWPVDFILSGVSDGLLATPPLLVVVVFAIIAWRVSGFKLAGFTVASLVLIGLLGLLGCHLAYGRVAVIV
jgi:glycine betaine/proline transport system permease protein